MRNTQQRESIRKVFTEINRPLRVDEILELARKEVPTLNLATVYRNLNRLISDGWLTQVDFPPLGTLYERADKPHHHHFYCRKCNTVLEMQGCGLDADKEVPSGFQVEGHELFLYGLCRNCSKNA